MPYIQIYNTYTCTYIEHTHTHTHTHITHRYIIHTHMPYIQYIQHMQFNTYIHTMNIYNNAFNTIWYNAIQYVHRCIHTSIHTHNTYIYMHAIQYMCIYIEHICTCYTYNTYLSTCIEHKHTHITHTYNHAIQNIHIYAHI